MQSSSVGARHHFLKASHLLKLSQKVVLDFIRGHTALGHPSSVVDGFSFVPIGHPLAFVVLEVPNPPGKENFNRENLKHHQIAGKCQRKDQYSPRFSSTNARLRHGPNSAKLQGSLGS